MTQHLALITKTQSLIAAGDIVGAESALAELADTEGDGALVVVLDQLPPKDVLAVIREFDTSKESVVNLVITPEQFARAVVIEKRYKDLSHTHLRGMVNSVIFREDADPIEFLNALAAIEGGAEALANYFSEKWSRVEAFARTGHFDTVEEDGDMPGHDDGQEKQPAGPEEDGAQPGPPGAGRDEEQAADNERKEDGNRSLGQKAETQHGIGVEQQAAGRLASAVGTEDIVDAEHRQRDEQVEQCIGNRCLGDEADGQRQPHDQGRHLRRPSVGMAQAETVEGQHPEYGKDDGRQAEADFADAEEADRGGLRPVDEDRLVVARRIVQGRRHQVAARHHLARRLRKGALVDVGQRQAPGIEHEGDRHDQQQADGRQEEALDGDGQAGG